MKRVIKVVNGLMLLFFVFVACSQNEASKEDMEFLFNGKAQLILNAGDNYSDSRTIFAERPNLDEMSYSLVGDFSYGDLKLEKNWESYSEMINDTNIFVNIGYWNFTLTASKYDTPLYVATISKNIDAGQNQLSFLLQEMEVEIENPMGDMNISLSFPDNADVKTVKAGLLSVSDYLEIDGYEFEELEIDDASNSVVYAKDEIPAGIYIVKFCLYRSDGSEIAPGYRELVQIKNKRTSSADVKITETENYHTLTLKNIDLEGVEISGSVSLTFSELKNVDLLDFMNTISRTGYMLVGWYDNENCEGKSITKITAGEATDDLTLWANWREEGHFYVDEGEIFKLWLSSKEGDGPFDVFIIGKGTSKEVSSMARLASKKINLDLSETKNLTSIDGEAFAGCENLANIVIPKSVTSIGKGAFRGCSSLSEITVPFVGSTAKPNSEWGHLNEFCYIFDSDVPSSLKKVTVMGGEICGNNNTTFAFNGCPNIETVILCDGVKSIGNYAFYGCSSFVKITMPKTLVAIGNYAFEGCSNLTEIAIPESVTSIGKSAFKNCTKLKEATIKCSIPNANDNDNFFYGCTSLVKITLTDNVLSIGNYAFYGCSSLAEIKIPNSVTSIGNYAFYGCSSLAEIKIPNSVTSIGNYAFFNCSSLAEITILETVLSIGNSAFYGCSSLLEITIPFVGKQKKLNNNNSKENEFAYIFGSTYSDVPVSLKKVTVTGGELFMGNKDSGAFLKCSNIETINLCDDIKSIGAYAFYGCSNLTEIILPKSIASIGAYAFYDCSKLEGFTMPNGVTSIGSYAFYRCSSITEIAISEKVVSVGKGAFARCESLKEAVIKCPTIVGADSYPWDGMFSYCANLTKIVLANSVISIGDSAFSSCSSLAEITIPNSVTSIGNSAFSSCSSLAEITIPNSVTSIGNSAFSSCSSLAEITIPESVTSIGSSAFSHCSKLVEITVPFVGKQRDLSNSSDEEKKFRYIFGFNYGEDVPESLKKVTVTGGVITGSYTRSNGAFYNCSNIETIILSENIKAIGSYAFSDCSHLKEIVIPESVTSIGNAAFYYCSRLAEITIPFVGKEKNCSSNTTENRFAYIFGSDYNNVPSSLKKVTITGGEIYECYYFAGAFYNCSNIETIILSGDIKNIGTYAFNGCSGLKEITIPDGIESIGDSAFDGCTGLETVYAETYEGWNAITFGTGNKSNPLEANSNVRLYVINARDVKPISVSFPDLEQISDVATLEYSIANNMVTLTAEEGHSTYSWFIDMQNQGETSNTMEIDATNMRGLYSVMVIIDGIYSSTATIRID